MLAVETKSLYKIGDLVLQTGNYICVPCGYVQYFAIGEAFITCQACFAGTELGPEGFQDPEVEFWQFLG